MICKLIPSRADVLRFEYLLFPWIPRVDLMNRLVSVRGRHAATRRPTAMCNPVRRGQKFHPVRSLESLDQPANPFQTSE